LSEYGSKETISRPLLEDDEFIIEKKFLSLDNKYYIRDSERKIVGVCQERSLTIKGELRVFSDEDKTEELFRIKQRNMLDFTGTFEVVDPTKKDVVGFLKRNWLKSMILGEWKIFDKNKEVIAEAEEDSLVKEALRLRGLKKLPYRYKLYRNGKKIGFCKQRLSLVKNVYRLQMNDRAEDELDRRLFISLALLLDTVEDKFRKIGK